MVAWHTSFPHPSCYFPRQMHKPLLDFTTAKLRHYTNTSIVIQSAMNFVHTQVKVHFHGNQLALYVVGRSHKGSKRKPAMKATVQAQSFFTRKYINWQPFDKPD